MHSGGGHGAIYPLQAGAEAATADELACCSCRQLRLARRGLGRRQPGFRPRALGHCGLEPAAASSTGLRKERISTWHEEGRAGHGGGLGALAMLFLA